MAVNNIIKRMQDIMRQDAGINGDAQRIEQMTWMFFLKVYDTQEDTWEYKAYKEKKEFVSIIPENLRWRNWAIDNKDGEALTGEALLKFVNEELFPTLKNLPVDFNTPRSKSIVKETFADLNQYMKNGTLLRQVVNVVNEIEFDDADDRHTFGDIYETMLKELQSAGNAGEFYTPRALTDFIVKMLAPQIGETFGDFTSGTGGFLTSALNYMQPNVKSAADNEKIQKAVIGQEWKPLPYLLSITNLLVHGIEAPNIRNCDSLGTNVSDFKESDKVNVIGMNPPYGGSTEASVKGNFPTQYRSSETADLFIVLTMYRLKAAGRAGVIIPDGFLFGTDGAKRAIKENLLRKFNLHTIIRLPGSIFSPYTSIATNILFFNNEQADGAKEGFKTNEVWFYRMDMPEGYKHFSKTKSMKLEHTNPIQEWWTDRKEIISDELGEKSRKFTAQQLLDMDCNFDQCKFPKDEEEVLPPDELFSDFHARSDKYLKDIFGIIGNLQDILSGKSIGQTQTDFKSFAKYSELIKSIPEALKRSILQEAIQGKLVPQDPNDEPASELLKRIRKEKEQLVKDGKLKKKDLEVTPIAEDEKPFDLPNGWEWERWGNISINIQYGYNASAETAGDIRMVRISDIQNNKVLWDTVPFCKINRDEIQKYLLQPNDILFARTGGTVGKSFLVKDVPYDSIYAGYLIRTRYSSLLVPEYLKAFMESSLYWEQLREGTIATAQPNCNGKTLSQMFIPIPPLAEQKRIVAKLEEILPKLNEMK
ncbi:MAG: N-6 DNA methylase [Bacteroidaceae bacterium]|nr:N-6 DNA methylase [Bacteroidaceae bacterium]